MSKYHDDLIMALVEKDQNKALAVAMESEYEYFYQYCAYDPAYSLKNIEEGNVVLSNPLDFNDPYDLYYIYHADKDVYNNLLPERQRLLQIKLKDPKWKKDFEKRMEIVYKKFLETWKEKKEVVFISCFSTVPESVLMWGHYAVKHTGYCIEYKKSDIIGICRRNNDLFGEVAYKEELTEISNRDEEGMQKLNEAVFTKHIDWKYEKEWRIVAIDYEKRRVNRSCGGHGKIIESGIKPNRILLGTNMSDDIKAEIRRVCDKYNIVCVDTEMSHKEYKIVEKRIIR